MSKKEVYISVDIETAGPIVGEHSMLSIGACFVYNPHIEFAIMLQPISDKAIEEALKVSNYHLQKFLITVKLKTEIPIRFGIFFISIYKNLFPNFEPIN